MKRLLAAICLVISVGIPASSVFGTTSVHAADVVNAVNLPTSGSIVDPCNGEVFNFSGYFHILIHVTGDMAGGFHLDIKDNAEAIKLVAANGDTGVGTEADHFTLNLNPGASNETSNGQVSINTNGSSPNFVVHYLLHITVNADGTVTAFVDNVTATCKG